MSSQLLFLKLFFFKNVSDEKKQANHIQKMHSQLQTKEMLKAAVFSGRRIAGVFTRHTHVHTEHTHTCVHGTPRLEGGKGGL